MNVLGGVLLRAGGLALVWWVLTEGRAGYLAYGLASVSVALAVSLVLSPPRRHPADRTGRRRPGRRAVGLASLAGWYAVQVVRGGVDVARRLLRRRPDVDPVVVRVRTRLPEGVARQFAVAMFGLMPGSLVCGTDGDEVSLHALAAELEPERQWRVLEHHLAQASGLATPLEP